MAGCSTTTSQGTVPPSLWALPSLTTINLAYNAYTGALPAQWSSLTNLTSINLGNNALSGSLPAGWGRWGAAQTVNLMNNRLTSSVPAAWGPGMVGLTRLVLSGNAGVCGSLPAGMAASKVVASGTSIGSPCANR